MKTLITRLFFALCIIILSGCENKNNDNSEPKSYTVLEAIEGTWEACKEYPDKNAKNEFKTKCINIGKINIKDGLYQFDQAEGINKEMFTKAAHNLNFLFDEPSGKVKIDYSGNVNPYDPLEIYSDGGKLAEISFISEQGEKKDRYSINVVKGGKSLFFRITYSSLGLWGGVGKNL